MAILPFGNNGTVLYQLMNPYTTIYDRTTSGDAFPLSTLGPRTILIMFLLYVEKLVLSKVQQCQVHRSHYLPGNQLGYTNNRDFSGQFFFPDRVLLYSGLFSITPHIHLFIFIVESEGIFSNFFFLRVFNSLMKSL